MLLIFWGGMKVAILDAKQGERNPANSFTVAYRNLLELKRLFNADLFVSASEISTKSDYDAIICGFGSTSTERDKSTDFLVRNKGAKIYWLVGEYEQSTFAPLFYSKRKFDVIRNFEHDLKNKMADKQHFVNINTLLYRNPATPIAKKYGAVYYGRWRQDRLPYFKKHLQGSIHLSTHSKNAKMFHHNGCNPKYIRPLEWSAGKETLSLFEKSLYIEDKYTHAHYNCLANRFYEALYCNVLPVFDRSCINTLERSGYAGYESLIVDAPKDIDEIKHDQGLLWLWQQQAADEKNEVLSSLKKILADG